MGRPKLSYIPSNASIGKPTKRSRELDAERPVAERLQCYASGDGALHFTFIDHSKPGGEATGRTVTLADVQGYINSEDGKSLRDSGWRIWQQGPWKGHLDLPIPATFALIAPVRRVDEHTFELYGHRYTVGVSSYHSDGAVSDHAMSVQTEIEGIGKIEVVNVNTRAAIRHFLSHEKKLPPL